VREILCYGDSNTWGYEPAGDGRRFAWPARWPGVLQRELGDGHHVVEDGLCGRTTVIDNALAPHRSGMALLAPALECHAPLDLVIIMLGTNDVAYPWATPAQVAEGAATLAHVVRWSEWGPGGAPPAALLVCPPPLGPFTSSNPEPREGMEETSRGLPSEFARAAAAVGCPWFDAGEIIASSGLDGCHLEATEHELLGVALAPRVRELLT
jgi:lysophospholipase L1-like esterase